MECVWTPTENHQNTSTSKIHIYDAGEYVGFLVDMPNYTSWQCWHVVDRTQEEGGKVREVLSTTPIDWVPFQVASVQEYPLLEYSEGGSEKGALQLQIPGWTLHLQAIPGQPHQEQQQGQQE